jgi:hypothetical protein
MPEPKASRPHIPGYGISAGPEGLISWSEVEKRIETARSYWIATVSAMGRPHSRPVDGIWLDGALYFAGGDVKWSRNLRENPAAQVHLESTEQVVILEGSVERIAAKAPELERVAEAGRTKYGNDYAGERWVFRPTTAFAWTNFAKDATRWRFH